MVWNRSLVSGSALQKWRRMRTLAFDPHHHPQSLSGVFLALRVALSGFSVTSGISLNLLTATQPMCILEFAKRLKWSLVHVWSVWSWYPVPPCGPRTRGSPLRAPPALRATARLTPPSSAQLIALLCCGFTDAPGVKPGSWPCCSIPFVFFFSGTVVLLCLLASIWKPLFQILAQFYFALFMVGRLVFACYCLTAKSGCLYPLEGFILL